MTTVTGVMPKQIYFNPTNKMEVGVIVNSTGIVANSDGKKIVKAGTPLTGTLDTRSTAFTLAATTTGVSNAVGILVHDVDVTTGTGNGALCIFGFVNQNRLETDVQALITAEVKTALNAKVTFLKD